jgi:hypothetical protein
VRLPDGESWEDIPKPLLEDCAQLTKANSIEGEDEPLEATRERDWDGNTGNKKDNVTIIYTPWSNLKKDGSMATGQVGFKDQKKVKRVYVAKRENPIVNRLNKTKVEKHPDFRQEKEDRAKELRKKDRSVIADRVRRSDFRPKRETLAYTIINRLRKKLALQERGKSWHTRGITHTMTGTKTSRSWLRVTRTAIRTGRTTSCERQPRS